MMKYKVGKNNMIAMYAEKKSPPSDLLTEKNNCIETGTLRINTKPNIFGYLEAKDSPCLFRNILSSVYVTLLALVNKYGTKEKVRMNDSTAKIGMKFTKVSTTPALIVIPSQNMILQKLSLLSRALSQFIIFVLMVKYFIISLSIAKFRLWSKTIRLVLAILIANFLIVSCLAQDLAELIEQTERAYTIPSGLLKSITSVESGNQPFALNISGKTILASSKEQAVAIVRLYQDSGVTNIDLGIAQINLYWHGKNFGSIAEMLEPKDNLEYAAKFLRELYGKHGSWNQAVRHYHSANPQYHIKYARKVLLTWLEN